MNLRDKLKAVSAASKPAAPPPKQFTDCYQRTEGRTQGTSLTPSRCGGKR